ncbi:GNAT family N-acetyltransferase [Roseisolibacter sp. H3M3-2]|uniref:GNAT family N-acetyltransferase n=1 Tax=Roseisolibacter sp. H3M3-2 TaxID=3031323 RepID=UPI0023DC3474|nr:GNAT family N-acetyltransferase [Roseisolibacter sp. H3M3-2]MDF1503034.1 GNAT family N-acetyltransferase [Roseisolibacter sp. H3M3-2]
MSSRVLVLRSPEPSRPPAPVALPEGYRLDRWRPGPLELAPPGPPSRKHLLFGVGAHAGLFAGPGYGAILVRRGDAVVHRSSVYPRYFAFPFMGRDDLQVGATWTDPAHRGRGLARAALLDALARCHAEGRRLWYLVEEENLPSIRAAAAAGLTVVAHAERRSRLGVHALGGYRIVRWEDDAGVTPPGTAAAPG